MTLTDINNKYPSGPGSNDNEGIKHWNSKMHFWVIAKNIRNSVTDVRILLLRGHILAFTARGLTQVYLINRITYIY